MRSFETIVTIGHLATDDTRARRSKSTFVFLMCGLVVFSLFLAFMPERTVLEQMADVMTIAILFGCVLVLHTSQNLSAAFAALMAGAVPIFAAFYFLHGNRDGDFYFLALMPASAVTFLGPRRSLPYLMLTVALAVTILAIDPMLPRVTNKWHVSPVNPAGWVFHSSDKYNLRGYEAFSFFTVIGILYWLIYSAAADLLRATRQVETLLINVLPQSIANRLIETKAEPGQVNVADNFDNVTVLFADIVGFTALAEEMKPRELVDMLNALFSEFDSLADYHNVEKVKTIGDAYMAVCGLPEPDERHAERVANLALGMRHAAAQFKTPGGEGLKLRIGINSGPVIAGVIGRRKFIYDLWGDTVNTASRMESAGSPSVIQTTESTYELLCHEFDLRSVEPIDIKGKGKLAVWQLIGKAA